MSCDAMCHAMSLCIITLCKPVAQLRVDLADFEGNYKYARYSYFSVGNPSTNYTLTQLAIGFAVHNGREFIAHDRGNDRHSGGVNCAEQWQSAWWHDM